jgi:hypothetical protein
MVTRPEEDPRIGKLYVNVAPFQRVGSGKTAQPRGKKATVAFAHHQS